ncbi:MAG: hypothetical protein KTR19_11180 [Hyphomicrobiales bacterium]|nr:hypothetical protein [Hyphomicrobiales bacterium]
MTILPANATDLYTPAASSTYRDAPAVVSHPNWAGFYAGGHVGGGWNNGYGRDFVVEGGTGGGGGGGGGDNRYGGDQGTIDGKNGQDGNFGGAGGAGGNSGDSNSRRIGGTGGNGGAGGLVNGTSDDNTALMGGIHLGYNWQYGKLVFGFEGDVSLNDSADDYLASIRARIGITPRPDLLTYVTAGLAYREGGGAGAIGLGSSGGFGGAGGQNDDGQDDIGEDGDADRLGGVGGAGGAGGDGSFAGFEDESSSDAGFVLGAGVEYMLTGNVSFGVEGLYYTFKDDQDVTAIRGRLTLHLDRSPHDSFKDSILSGTVANWSGFYAGGSIGAGFGSGERAASVKTDNGQDGQDGERGAEGSVNSNGELPNGDGIDDPGGAGGGGGGGAAALVTLENDSGFLGGVHVGYNWQDESLVYGLEGDASWGDRSFRDYLASVRVRVGHSFDQVLLYGTAGVAFGGRSGALQSVSLSSGGNGGDGNNGSFENDPAFDNGVGGAGGAGGQGGTATVTYDDGDDQVGFVVGGGVEVKLWDNTSFGLEGLYYGFDGEDATSSTTSYGAGDDLSSTVVRGRMTIHLQDEPNPLK